MHGQQNVKIEFYVLLTVHPGVTLDKRPNLCTITLYKTFIIVILYMFGATLCSSSVGRIALIQHLVQYSLQVTVRCVVLQGTVPSQPAHRNITYREHYTRCCINTIRPPDDKHTVARNM